MSSIRSTLIRSTISKLQGELEQLENWLNRDYVTTAATTSVAASTDGNIIYHAIQQLSKQMDSQQHTLNHLIDRLDVLEGTRNIHIEDPSNPWLDAEVTQLQNELVHDLDSEYETIINVNKSEEPMVSEKSVVVEPVAVAEPVAVVATLEPIAVIAVVEPIAALEPVAVIAVAESVAVVEPIAALEPVAVVATLESVAVVAALEPVAKVQEEEEVQKEEEEEEEEEMEYEEVEFKGETFYRDTQQYIFRMDEEGQLSEDPIGYWKVKSQTIMFYQK
jgi:hypothetical protein